MSNAKRKTIKRSSLEKIKGIGPSKAKELLKHFGTVTAIKEASVDALAAAKGISRADAENIYSFFNSGE